MTAIGLSCLAAITLLPTFLALVQRRAAR
jgi:hypothetical protein